MFENQPKGLFALALANTGERSGYYTVIAVFVLFLRANFELDPGTAGMIYSVFLELVYFFPLVGGVFVDKFGFGKMVTIGIVVIFLGYLFSSIPLGGETFALSVMLLALLSISFGTGSFKSSLQVMVGNLYDDPKYADKRDLAFSIFYITINIGVLFVPTAAVRIEEWAESVGYAENDAYHFSFAVACVPLIISIAMYYGFCSTFHHMEGNGTAAKTDDGKAIKTEELGKKDVRDRVAALLLVFAVVIFFWMSFHQNGLTLAYFANELTQRISSGVQSMAFDMVNFMMIVLIVYAGFSFFQSKTQKVKGTSLAIIVAAIAVLIYKYTQVEGAIGMSASIFQQFNPLYVVALTPVSVAIFGSLAAKSKEPSAPRKIAYGMVIAAFAYTIMIAGSQGLLTPNEQALAAEAGTANYASANWLTSIYLVLTFGELLLSPMDVSFVSKVAPPKLKGAMMGGWFAATAIGNLLVSIGGYLWGNLPVWAVWSVLTEVCLLSVLFMFSVMRRLEKVCQPNNTIK